MIHYTFYQKNPASHYIYIDMLVNDVDSEILQLELPAWRPGRYELGNFAKNIKRVDAFGENGEVLEYTKLSKDLWEIKTRGNKHVKITYSYYAAELNAGACYADVLQMYVNPVHCCMFVVGRTSENHRVELKIPEDYRIICSLPLNGSVLEAVDFDELADSPFVATAQVKSEVYRVEGIDFHLHFIGECRPDFEKIKKDFNAFTKHQINFWGDFPYDVYHFIFQVTPYRFYHGVEHKKNTVIAIGPGYAINSGDTYEDILGVSCHELFHTWNVKTIRPAEMLPYDFSKENYARTGYVYEGFTTYYGDKLLLGSGVFNLQQYFKTLEERLVKHFHNFGRFNLSVAASSWETWLDGYVPGAPYRKTNIYDEGSLVALMLDVFILRSTGNQKSLREVCVLLYERFGKKNLGYTEKDVISLVNEVSGADSSGIFTKYVYGTNDFEEGLSEAFVYLGWEMEKKPSSVYSEDVFGFKSSEVSSQVKVSLVAPYSPAWKAGLFAGDDILAVNNLVVKNNLNHWLSYFESEGNVTLLINSGDRIRQVELTSDTKKRGYFFNPVLKVKAGMQLNADASFRAWLRY